MADPLLDASAAAVFNALRSDGRVSVPLDALTKATGLSPAEVDASLDQLASADVATAWTSEGGIVATFTVRAAADLGLRPDRRSFRWLADDEREPRERRASSRTVLATDFSQGDDGGSGLPDLADPDAVEPIEVALEVEALGKVVPSRTRQRLTDVERMRLFQPRRILMGSGGWINPRFVVGPCQVCGSRPLPWDTLCGLCEAWGLTWLASRRRATDRPAKARPRVTPGAFRPNIRRKAARLAMMARAGC